MQAICNSLLCVIALFAAVVQPLDAVCGHSPYITGDPITAPDGQSVMITTISPVYDSYDTNCGVGLRDHQAPSVGCRIAADV